MDLTREDILEYALRYVKKESVVDFPMNGDIFCMLEREYPENKVLKDDEGWRFVGYNYCINYQLDVIEKPEGKWIWINFISLNMFPPRKQNLKLQPPHIALGLFHSPDRSHQIKILRISTEEITEGEKPPSNDSVQKKQAKIFSFPKKSK